MAIQTKTPTSIVDEVISSNANDKYYPFFNTSPNEDIALNALGTAKVMCRCNGTPGFMKKVRSLEDIKDHGRLCLRRNSRPTKRDQVVDEKAVDPKCKDDANKSMNPDKKQFTPNSHASRHMSASAIDNDALSNLEKQRTPFSFSVFWNSVKNTNDLSAVAKALRILCPEQINQGKFVFLNYFPFEFLATFVLFICGLCLQLLETNWKKKC